MAGAKRAAGMNTRELYFNTRQGSFIKQVYSSEAGMQEPTRGTSIAHRRRDGRRGLASNGAAASDCSSLFQRTRPQVRMVSRMDSHRGMPPSWANSSQAARSPPRCGGLAVAAVAGTTRSRRRAAIGDAAQAGFLAGSGAVTASKSRVQLLPPCAA